MQFFLIHGNWYHPLSRPKPHSKCHISWWFLKNEHLQSDRIFWLVRDFKDYLVSSSLSWTGTPSIRPSDSKPHLASHEYIQASSIHSFSEQSVSVPHQPHCKECPLYIWSKGTHFHLKAISPCPITIWPFEKSLPKYMCWKAAIRPSWSLFFSKLNSLNSCSPSS